MVRACRHQRGPLKGPHSRNHPPGSFASEALACWRLLNEVPSVLGHRKHALTNRRGSIGREPGALRNGRSSVWLGRTLKAAPRCRGHTDQGPAHPIASLLVVLYTGVEELVAGR